MKATQLLTVTVLAALLAGCSDRFQPSVEQSTEAPHKSRMEKLREQMAAEKRQEKNTKQEKNNEEKNVVTPEMAQLLQQAGHSSAPQSKSNNHSSSSGTKLPISTAKSKHKKSIQEILAAHKDVGTGREVKIDGMLLTAPETWQRKQPAMKLILAAFVVPKGKDDSRDTQVTVTVIGENSSTTMKRIREQLKKKPSGQGVSAAVKELTLNGHNAILTEVTVSPKSKGPFGAPMKITEPLKTLNVILPLNKYVYFINCAGPKKTVEAHTEEFLTFLRSIKPLKEQPPSSTNSKKEKPKS